MGLAKCPPQTRCPLRERDRVHRRPAPHPRPQVGLKADLLTRHGAFEQPPVQCLATTYQLTHGRADGTDRRPQAYIWAGAVGTAKAQGKTVRSRRLGEHLVLWYTGLPVGK